MRSGSWRIACQPTSPAERFPAVEALMALPHVHIGHQPSRRSPETAEPKVKLLESPYLRGAKPQAPPPELLRGLPRERIFFVGPLPLNAANYNISGRTQRHALRHA